MVVDLKLVVRMADGSIYEIPALIIAENRAKSYADDNPGNYAEVFEATLKDTLLDHDELVDWAANNMDWADVAEHAKRTRPPKPQGPEDMWCDAEMEVHSR